MAIGNPISLTSNVATKTISVIATASQSIFTVNGGYRINELAVFRNGVRLVDGRDFTARDGSIVTLLSAASEGDALEFQVFDTFRVADAITPFDSAQTIEGDLSIVGVLSATTLGSVNFNLTSGIQTFHDVRVGGALTVAGSLTYEDTTNTNTVGLATFSGGMNISGVGATVTTLNVTGVSTFASNVSIADSIFHTGDTDTALRFPAADTFTVETGGSEAVRVDSSQRLLVGTTSVIGSGNDLFVLKGTAAADASFYLGRNANASSISNGNNLGFIKFGGGDGGEAARISGIADGTWSSTSDCPGRLTFATTADGAATPTERLRITSGGNLGVGNDGSFPIYAGTNDRTLILGTGSEDSAIQIHSGTSNYGGLYFGDATSGSNRYRGYVEFKHGTGDDFLRFGTAAIEALRVDSSQRLLITGGNTTLNVSGFNPNLQVAGTAADSSSLMTGRFGNNASAPLFIFHKSRNASVNGNTIVQDDDILGRIAFYGADGSDYEEAAHIQAQVDGTPGAGTDMPGRLVFATTADGDHNATERLRISANGNIGIGGITGDKPLHVRADGENYPLLLQNRTNSSSKCGMALIATGSDFSDGQYATIEAQSGGVGSTLHELQFKTCTSGGTPTTRLTISGAGDATFTGAGTFGGILTVNNHAKIYRQTDGAGNALLNLYSNVGSTENNVVQITTEGNATFDGTVSDGKGELRSIPQNSQASTYTLVAADAGKHILAQNTITIPNSVLSGGDAVTIVNHTSGNITLSSSLTTLYMSSDGSTTSTRTLATRGMATLLFVSGTSAYISGVGLS